MSEPKKQQHVFFLPRAVSCTVHMSVAVNVPRASARRRINSKPNENVSWVRSVSAFALRVRYNGVTSENNLTSRRERQDTGSA